MARDSFAEKSDEELMATYQNGDSEAVRAFEMLFDRHSGRVMSYLLKKLASKRDAQDLTQEVFLKLHRSRHQYDASLPFAPWLFTIARTVQLDYWKKTRREDATDPQDLERLTESSRENASVEIAETEEARSTLGQSALSALPPQQREAIAMRVFDEATFDEIATRLSVSPDNARQLVSRGLRKLKNALVPGKARERSE